jgi:YidC/Oxa1 family membrane protein insertase
MKKQDLIIVILLFAALFAWPFVARKLFPPPPAKPTAAVQPGRTNATQPAITSQPPELAPTNPVVTAPPAASNAVEPTVTNQEPSAPEQRLVLTNAETAVTVSSWGGGIVAVELKQYRQTGDRQSPPLALDFSAFPALAYSGLAGLSGRDDFEVGLAADGAAIRVAKVLTNGLTFTRTITLEQDFRIKVEDVFTNTGAEAVTLREHEAQVGPMHAEGAAQTWGLDDLGVDAQPSIGGESVVYWAGKLVKLFKTDKEERGLAGIPDQISKKEYVPVDWVAAKSKFFVQILAPDGGGAAYRVRAKRVLVPGEREDPRKIPKDAEIAGVSATVLFAETTLAPGAALTRALNYYAGPKKYSILKRLGLNQEEVMDFGWWKWFCKLLLIVLNFLYDCLPNYGVAIIILTILIRIIFWPLTHKSTENMKKMQEKMQVLQPLLADIKAKYKNNPKKLQEETLNLYRKHNINPAAYLGGCLPMLVQMPVFIAFFVVLRSAVELRFANFLWIHDLSAPENLLAGMFPSPIGALNILPIVNAATIFWQQKLTPTIATDPNQQAQQKMMLWLMPIMMLVMFYKMPSALVLYWTANQVIMIAQLLIQKKRAELKKKHATA